nr:hypothetical protein BaRGS_014574 [Batillaria attramentaria]
MDAICSVARLKHPTPCQDLLVTPSNRIHSNRTHSSHTHSNHTLSRRTLNSPMHRHLHSMHNRTPSLLRTRNNSIMEGTLSSRTSKGITRNSRDMQDTLNSLMWCTYKTSLKKVGAQEAFYLVTQAKWLLDWQVEHCWVMEHPA